MQIRIYHESLLKSNEGYDIGKNHLGRPRPEYIYWFIKIKDAICIYYWKKKLTTETNEV